MSLISTSCQQENRIIHIMPEDNNLEALFLPAEGLLNTRVATHIEDKNNWNVSGSYRKDRGSHVLPRHGGNE